nr:PREDICTED: putative gustatory receptor 23a, isoform B [Linepithema humile]
MYVSYTCFLSFSFVTSKSISTRVTIEFVKHVIGYISLSANTIAIYSSQNLFGKYFDRLDSYDHEVARVAHERRDNFWIPWIATFSTTTVILLLIIVMTQETSMGILFFVFLSDICTIIMHLFNTLEKFLILYLILIRFKHLNEKIIPHVVWNEKHSPWNAKKRRIKTIKISDVKIMYLMLYDAQQAFNGIYSNSLLLWFSTIMIHILANVRIFREKSPLISCAFVVPPIIQLLTLCAICHYTAEEANKIPCTLNEGMSMLANSGQTTDKISTLTYFLHNRVSFEAAGFFTINLPLFQSIIATITTYFIIL